MTGNGYRLFPALYTWVDGWSDDGSSEYGSIKNRPDGSVGALPLLLQIVFAHPIFIGSNCCTLYTYTKTLDGLCTLYRHLVISIIPVFQSKVIIFSLQVYKWIKQFVFYHLPDDSCHFIAVNLHQRSLHYNLFHLVTLYFV